MTDRAPDRRPTPHATYRVQLTPSFDFDAAAGLTGYLEDLGVSHLYTSPILQAQPGSTHGYDVIDHQQVSRELGGDEGFARLGAALATRGLGLVLDIVPNHMAVTTPGNRWWADVLRDGRASRYAPFFDIDWAPPEDKLADKILVPVLGDHYGRVLEAGELQVVRDGAELGVAYYEHRFPISPRTIAEVVERVAAKVGSEALDFLARSLRRLPPSTARPAGAVEERQVDGPVLLRMLHGVLTHPDASAALDAELAALNTNPDALDELIARQNYRLAYWRTSARELDYRRFFDVDQLAGLRVEVPAVFAETHARVLDWVASGRVHGVRVDHVDGLRDPGVYLSRLRERLGTTWLVVEKILAPDEALPADWPVAGTTGYEYAALASGLFVDPDGEEVLTRLHTDLSGDARPYHEVLVEAKHLVMDDVLGSEVNRLTESLVQVCEHHRRVRDFSRHELHQLVREVLAALAVYRTYVSDDGAVTDADRTTVEHAVAEARARREDLDPELFELMTRILLAQPHLDGAPERELRARFQQVSGAIMAKSEEDTTFYRYVRLLALNEVGGDPARFGTGPGEYHEAMVTAQAGWPATMVTLTTHDTKRSEDVRARLAVLSEMPERWAAAVRSWRDRHHRLPGAAGVDGTTRLYLYQTLVGAHPLPPERARTHLEKAAREAKARTSWVQPDERFEADLRAFIDALYQDRAFQEELAELVAPLVGPGRVNALGQKLLQLTAPGVPDIYQGQELWDLSLVDPDNRRPVDFRLRRELLDRLARGDRPRPADLDDPADAGLAKLLVVTRALAVRRDRPAAFGPRGAYEPVAVEADDGREVAAVVAHRRGDEVVVVVPRLVLRHPIAGRRAAVALPPGQWRDTLVDGRTLTGTVPVADLLAPFPAALLVRV